MNISAILERIVKCLLEANGTRREREDGLLIAELR